ncbi:MAG: Uma2 family endonuclease [Cyanobacterium sp. T60_A2020_053]|nr:Uma2 family endonuclease [Cyanobacterium sp. T60_A2020_053]
MIQALLEDNYLNFAEFINWYPESSQYRYELHNGTIIQMPKPKGKHSQIAGFLLTELTLEIRRLKLPYFAPKECLIKGDALSGYEPDGVILDKNYIENELLWEKQSTLLSGKAIKLVIEVVSTNWSDDYALKLDAYENLGIKEYWIVDYLGIGGRKFIGYPKQPTLTIYTLKNGEYEVQKFRDNEIIKSIIFPQLKLNTEQIFQGDL